MINEKTISCLLVALLFLMMPAYAQELSNADRVVAKMQTELNLSPDQLSKVKIIIAENLGKRHQISPNSTEGLSQSQSQPLDSELYKKLSEVLTRSQMDHINTASMLQNLDTKNGETK